MRLTSGTTTLRRLQPADLSIFQAYRQDPDIARYQDWEAMSDARATGFLTHMARITPLMRLGQWAQVAVTHTGTDVLIGDMGLYLSEDGTEAEVGITLAAAHHGQGHATRALRLASQFLFDETEIAHIRAYADVRNTPSRALMKRAGFTQTGTTTTAGVKEAVFLLNRP